jgi:hypothetical protein
MADWSKNDTIFTQNPVKNRWKSLEELSQEAKANETAMSGAEEGGKMTGNEAHLENEINWEDDANLELWPELSPQLLSELDKYLNS